MIKQDLCWPFFHSQKVKELVDTASRPKFCPTSERLSRRLINAWSSEVVRWKDNFMLSSMIWFSGKESSRKVPRIQREKSKFASSHILMEMLAALGDLGATLPDGWSSGAVRWKDNFMFSLMIWFSGKESSRKDPRIQREKSKFEPSQILMGMLVTLGDLWATLPDDCWSSGVVRWI